MPKKKQDGVGLLISDPQPTSPTTLSKKMKMTCDTWHVIPDMWHRTSDTWHTTPDMWHRTRDTWHLIFDTWLGVNTVLLKAKTARWHDTTFFLRICAKFVLLNAKKQNQEKKLSNHFGTIWPNSSGQNFHLKNLAAQNNLLLKGLREHSLKISAL